jgi:hypothetical protein
LALPKTAVAIVVVLLGQLDSRRPSQLGLLPVIRSKLKHVWFSKLWEFDLEYFVSSGLSRVVGALANKGDCGLWLLKLSSSG